MGEEFNLSMRFRLDDRRTVADVQAYVDTRNGDLMTWADAQFIGRGGATSVVWPSGLAMKAFTDNNAGVVVKVKMVVDVEGITDITFWQTWPEFIDGLKTQGSNMFAGMPGPKPSITGYDYQMLGGLETDIV